MYYLSEVGGLRYICAAWFILVSCGSPAKRELNSAGQDPDGEEIINISGQTIADRFNPPPGFVRSELAQSTFGFYLRHLQLKPHESIVRYYDGSPKINRDVYISVIDMDTGDRDLQQCADAVMRLRAEYLYENQSYQDIHFNFISDGQPRYYEEYAGGDHSYTKFRKYMDYIFSYANTRSLSQELTPVGDYGTMQVGDVFIQTGNPFGHAVIVVDMAYDPRTKEKLFMLAQSYMPAQDIQILINRNNSQISP